MILIKWIIGVLVLSIIILAMYLAWQNRASEKVISNFIAATLAGSTVTLVTILFSINSTSQSTLIYKTYIYNRNTKQQLYDESKPFLHTILGPEFQSFRPSLIAQEIINIDPDLNYTKMENSGKKCAQLYKDIFFRQLINIMSSYCDPGQVTNRVERLDGISISSANKQSGIRTRHISWRNIIKKYPDNLCFSILPESEKITGGLGIPADAEITFEDYNINIKNKFIKLTISVKHEGGGFGTGVLKSLLQIDYEENMKYAFDQYELNLIALFNPIRSGHPLMNEYKSWIRNLIKELTYQFSTKQHL